MRLYYSVLFMLPVFCYGQSLRDSILVNERSMDRPLTLHKGQLRIEGGYGLSAITKRFDNKGEPVRLRDEGRSFVRHHWLMDFRYGLFENLTLIFSANLKKQAERTEQVLTITDEVTELFEIQHKTGMEDPLIALSVRAPFTAPVLDIVLTGGMYLPVSAHAEAKPEHTIEDIGYRSMVYHYNRKWGNGVAVGVIGGNLKYRGKDFALTGSFTYDHPLGETRNVRWQHQLVNNKFHYQQQPYRYQLPNRMVFSIEAERQLTPWFDLTFIFFGEKTRGGWDEINGSKFTRVESRLLSFNPGYEILVTPKIWLRQRIHFPLSGKAADAPFSIYTSLVYNFFPFN